MTGALTIAFSGTSLVVDGDIDPDVGATDGFIVTVVDTVTSSNVGEYTSIFCVSDTDCKISYYDVQNSNLMFTGPKFSA